VLENTEQMLTIFEKNGKPCFRVRVQPRSSHQSIVGCWNTALKVCLTAPPLEDRANRQLLELLADTLAVPRASIRILSGHRSRLKTVQILTLSRKELKTRITPYLV
jgi:uncharacterized protein (TIGR00251 family)